MLQYTTLQNDTEWKRKQCIFSYQSRSDREPFSVSAAVTEKICLCPKSLNAKRYETSDSLST